MNQEKPEGCIVGIILVLLTIAVCSGAMWVTGQDRRCPSGINWIGQCK